MYNLKNWEFISNDLRNSESSERWACGNKYGDILSMAPTIAINVRTLISTVLFLNDIVISNGESFNTTKETENAIEQLSQHLRR